MLLQKVFNSVKQPTRTRKDAVLKDFFSQNWKKDSQYRFEERWVNRMRQMSRREGSQLKANAQGADGEENLFLEKNRKTKICTLPHWLIVQQYAGEWSETYGWNNVLVDELTTVRCTDKELGIRCARTGSWSQTLAHLIGDKCKDQHYNTLWYFSQKRSNNSTAHF